MPLLLPHPRRRYYNLLGIINVDFDATGQLLIKYSAPFKYLRKIWEYNKTGHQLFIHFKKAYDSVLYSKTCLKRTLF
jgi:hypothetical protein